jgi:hypothetical protein
VLVVIAATAAAFAVPSAAQATSGAAAASAAAATAREEAALARTVSDVPTLSSQDSADMADLGVIPGCSQGGHEALTEARRYPDDFNGILAGAPASIMTELNSVLHEYTFEANYTKPGYAGSTILDQPEADIILDAAVQACDPKVGIILDNQACERTFNLNSVLCSATLTTNCLTAAQVAVARKLLIGPVDAMSQLLYPGGYSLSSAFDWSNGTSVNLPLIPGGTVTPASFITAWLQYFAFEKNIGTTGVTDEPFTAAYFDKLEKLAPFWDATDPDLQAPIRWLGKFDTAMVWCNNQGLDCRETT